MHQSITLKLVLRNWRRNKIFAIISILSLAVGIACTNLLIMFIIHEYNIETGNPDKERIIQMIEYDPIEKGKESSYIMSSIPTELKEKYGEVEEVLRFISIDNNFCKIENKKYAPLNFVATDASLSLLFPSEVLYGNITEALSQPGKLVLTEETASRLFGKASALGKTVTINTYKNGDKEYQVAAIVKSRQQSFIKFDALTKHTEEYFFGITFLKMKNKPDIASFTSKVKKDNIRRMSKKNKFLFYSLQDSYFNKKSTGKIDYLNRRQPILLYIGFASALLILLIACFNYINLSFSRILQQLKMLHTEKLMGASDTQLRKQIFMDTFLTVSIAFALSVLLLHDFLPLFNSVISAQLPITFFYSKQVFPVIIIFGLLLSVVPAIYISSKLSRISGNSYKLFYTGKKKQYIVSGLVIIQFTVSLGLIIASITITKQLNLIQHNGEHYNNIIEIGNKDNKNTTIHPFIQELKNISTIKNICISRYSILNLWLSFFTKEENGKETGYYGEAYCSGRNYLQFMNINLIKGFKPDEAIQKYSNPIYISKKFADLFVPHNTDPIGKQLNEYTITFDIREDPIYKTSAIAGIVEDIHIGSMEDEVNPVTILLTENTIDFSYVCINIGDKNQQETLARIKALWEKYNPDTYFNYCDVKETFLKRNKKTIELTNLLLMYSFISIILTCSGLFGMVIYATEQGTKEIGIRKINGATTWQIILLLNKQFIIWIGIAFCIIIPLVWYLLNSWLEQFTYRTEQSIGVYLLSAGIVTGISLLTVSWHSYKAANNNPVNCLKDE